MIDARCECGVAYSAPEADAGRQSILCRKCGREIRLVSAEALPEGAGAGDFDTRLVVTAGPARVGEQFVLGGCCEIDVGKLPERHLALAGEKVSRLHCKLLRLDFGPSRWSLADNHSTNGLFVNGQRVTSHELRHGDVVHVGDYQLTFLTDAALFPPAPAGASGGSAGAASGGEGGGVACPGCEQWLIPGAKLCTDCGIYVPSGRPLVTAEGLDDERVAEVARASIYMPSFLTLFGILPVASEAFATRKPYAIWTIAGITVLCSFAFFPVSCGWVDDPKPFTLNLMQWTGSRELKARQVEAQLEMVRQAQERLRRQADRLPERYYEREKRELAAAKRAIASSMPDPAVGFQPQQWFTNTLLHADLLHLAGNLLFLLVFGLRVNELIGNTRMFIVYPVLGILASAIDQWASRDQPLTPGLGASGAIAGLAGMYLVFFPVQRVRMIAYVNLWLLTAFQCFSVMFWMRGFWLLVLLFVWGDVVPLLRRSNDHVAHWAHLGGFGTGILLAVGLLVARQVQARGDILSVALGRRAWPLVGRPRRATDDPAPAAA